MGKDKNKVKYGLDNVYYSTVTENEDSVTYGEPIRIHGAVNIALNPEGEGTKMYADNSLYHSTTANLGYTGDLEVSLLPDSFKIDILGEKEDKNGVVFENKDAKTKYFALLFEFDGDVNKTRHIFYKVQASRVKMESGTKSNSSEPRTDTMPIVASPAIDTGDIKAKAISGDAIYNTWFTTVYKYVTPTSEPEPTKLKKGE